MRVYNRPFDEKQNDFEKMWEFLIEDYAYKNRMPIWTIGRLGDWKYGCWNEKKCFPNFMRKNAQLWLNHEEIVGFVISEYGGSDFSVLSKRGYEFLYPEMLRWLKNNWNDREGELTTRAHEYQDRFIQVLEEEGFVQSGQDEVGGLYLLSEKAKEAITLDSEFSIEDMFEHPDLLGKTKLYCNAFGNKNEISNFDLLKYEYNRESPCFNPRFDLSVVNKDGMHVASCVAFIDYKNNYAEIEKVCSHSDYRRRGLAEAVIRECFKRLYDEGIQYANLGGESTEAKGLYAKLGPIKSWKWFNYSLPKNK